MNLMGLADPLNFTGWNTYKPVDSSGAQPGRPNYVAGYDPSTMSLTDYLSGKYDPSGLRAYKDQAMRKGPSSWASLALQQQKEQEGAAREKGAAQVNTQTAQAEDNLAARGGLSSGARERAATEGSKNYLSMSQDLSREGTQNAMQIGINDETNRIQQLSTLPGMEMQQAGMFEDARAKDIANTTGENDKRNAYNTNVYNQQMQAWAASKQADATTNSGKHGFLGTGK